MAAFSHSESRRMYSWWWDSHISPKNSKWLQENLTDMDSKVKAMIKLIEEDADSFARRAEMYYKKRPELMKLVEEFYRAYRALAERYDHATGALRQAHRTMAEAFPNQVPFVLTDDSPSGSSVTEAEPHTPEMPHPLRALFDPDDLHKDALGLSSPQFHAIKRNGANSDEHDSLTSKKGLKQFGELFGSGEEVHEHAKFAEGRVRKGLNFHEEDDKGSEYKVRNESRDLPKSEAEGKERSLQDGASDLSTENQNFKSPAISKYVQAGKTEAEIHTLKEGLAKLEAEKDAGILRYEQSLDRLSNLETEISRAQDNAMKLNERASKAETEVQTLKQALSKLEGEKEAALVQYQKCLERISALESKISCFEEDAGGLNDRTIKAETEVQALKDALTKSEAEREAGLMQYKQCLETISNLEAKISSAEENARRLNERADKAENDVQSLKQSVAKLNEDKEAAAHQYQRCLEIEISRAQEETRRLNNEIVIGVSKLNSAEEKYLLLEKASQALQAEVETLSQKTGIQRQALLDKHEELEKLRISIQEEGLRSMQAESALQALQNSHSQSQEEQRALAMELQKRILMLKDMELWNQGLENEVRRVKEENKNLNEQNLSSAMSINNLQDQIFRLKEMTGKLEEEVELRLDQRNALQQEIYCLKEEINDLNKRHQGLINQVQLVGLNPNSLEESVKELQEENSKLKEICQKDKDEKVVLFDKLEKMEKLLEKNALLENSLSDVNAELEGSRDKVKALEESYQSLQGEKFNLVAEKAILVSQLEIATQNMEKLSEKNTLLENSLSDTNVELESLRAKAKSLEESCLCLDNDMSGLLTERDTLVSHLQIFQERLEELEKRYSELEDKYLGLENEKESTIYQVEELRASLDIEKQQHGSFVLSSEIRLASLEDQIRLLQEEGRGRRKDFEEEQDKSIKAQVEIIILQRCIRDIEEKYFSLLIECQKHFEESNLSKKLISELEQEYLEEQIEANSLLNQLEKLRMGIHRLLKLLKIDPDCKCQDKIVEDELLLQHILGKVEDTECCLLKAQDEKQQLLFEKSVLVTLLEQLRLEAADIESERNTLDWESKIRTDELLMLQSEKLELLETDRQLRLELTAGDQREQVLKAEMEHIRSKLSDLQDAYQVLQNEKSKLLEGNRSLMKEFSELKVEKGILEEETSLVLVEAISLSNLSLIFKSFGAEKAVELEGLSEDLNHLHGVNSGLEKEVKKMGEKLEMVEAEKLLLKGSIGKLGNELDTVKNVSNDLNHQIGIGKDMLSQKEMELSDVEQKLKATERENKELHGDVESLKRDYNEARTTIEVLEKKILELSEDNAHQKKESGCLHKAYGKLESELAKLHEEIKDHKIKEENLSLKLQEKRNEVELCEAEAATMYGDLQNSTIQAALFEEKVHELIGACESLEDESASKRVEIEKLKERVFLLEDENGGLYGDLQISTICAALFKEKVHELVGACENLEDESASKRLEIERLKERVFVLESENGGLNSKSAAYFPVIVSLRDSLTSLEDHVVSRTKILIADNQETKDVELVSDLHGENFQEPSDNRSPVVLDGASDLQELQTRVLEIENAVMVMERLAMQESLVAKIKLEAAMKEIEKLKYTSRSIQKEGVKTGMDIVMRLEEERGDEPGNLKLEKSEPEMSKVRNGIVMKDIPLDQVTESLSHDHGFDPHGKKIRRENAKTDDEMLELWETTEQDYIVDHQINKAEMVPSAHAEEDTGYQQIEAVEEEKSEYPSSEFQIEKELGVDRQEVSKRSGEPHQGNRRKVLERLVSDAQKLTNLQITVQDLKRKVETSSKSKKAKGTEYDTAKAQLQEVEETLMQLVDVNGKLKKNAEEASSPGDGKTAELEGTGKVRRRRVSEQARRGSEKIGRLQLEVQRIQFLLLKLEDEHGIKRTNTSKRSTRVLLRDYIYGGGRSNQGGKKTPCCACVRPATKGE